MSLSSENIILAVYSDFLVSWQKSPRRLVVIVFLSKEARIAKTKKKGLEFIDSARKRWRER